MPIDTNALTPEKQQQVGHYEVLGENYAAFQLFESGWNPYPRFLDVNNVDFILRKLEEKKPIYREAQVKYGKLYAITSKWEKGLFDVARLTQELTCKSEQTDGDGNGANSDRRVSFRNAEEEESLGSRRFLKLLKNWHARTTERPSFYILKIGGARYERAFRVQRIPFVQENWERV